MLCPHCQSSVEPGHKYCPHCGKIIDPDFYGKKKSWYSSYRGILWLAFLCLAGFFIAIYAWTQPGPLEEIVEKQISAIKSKHFTQAYYDYTGKDFQVQTSLEEFRDFVSDLSPYIENKSVTFTERLIEGDLGLVNATLTSQEGQELKVEYKLGKLNDNWKILSLRVVIPGKDGDEKALVEPVQNQLAELKSNNFKGAYEEVVSKGFKESTPFEVFRLFVQAYPVLTNYNSYAISQKTIQGKDAEVSVILDTDQEPVSIRYKLTQEDNRWKIRGLEVVLPGEEEQSYTLIVETMQNFLNDLRSKDLAQAYQDYTSKEFQNRTVLGGFEDFIRSHPSLINSSPVVIKVSLSDSIGIILGALTSKSGETQPLEVHLVQEGGIWKILDIKLSQSIKSEG